MTFDSLTDDLRVFILQRPGFDLSNYAECASAYRADYRACLRQRDDALVMLRAVANASDSDLMRDCLINALRSGRLTLDGDRLDYCTGQYFPTEYRAAACRVLASALWAYWRSPESTADSLRAIARNQLGRAIARRWFN